MVKRSLLPKQTIESRQWTNTDEIDRAIEKLRKRITELENLDIRTAARDDSAAVKVVTSNFREAIREVFGLNSPEFQKHEHTTMWAGGMWVNMGEHEVLAAKEKGRRQMIGILQGLIGRLQEKGTAKGTLLLKLRSEGRLALGFSISTIQLSY